MLRALCSRLGEYPVCCWIWNIGICIDQFFNTVFWLIPMPGKTSLGSGDPDETLSHWWAHLAHEGVPWAERLNRLLDWIDPGHAPQALIADNEGFNTPTKMSERAKLGIRIIISGIR